MQASTKNPLIITDKEQMRKWSRTMISQAKTIGLVPTIGSLLQGHLSLVKEAFKQADVSVVSIYLNPGQFATFEDFYTYPSDFHGDIIKLMSVPGRVDVVFHPYNLCVSDKVRDLDFPVRIIVTEIVPDNDGLALSSRNVFLSAKEREKVLPVILGTLHFQFR